MEAPANYFDNNLFYLGSLALAAGIAYVAYIGLQRMFERERV